MGEATLVRTVRFQARHRYWCSDWTDAENRRAFGANADSHTHDYSVCVALRGIMDSRTGFVVDLEALDGLLRDVVGPLEGEDLDRAIPEARDGTMMPSTESLAAWFWEALVERIPGDARLVRVGVRESDSLAAEYEG